MKSEIVPDDKDYTRLVAEIKTRIQSAQVRAASAVSRELILLYHEIGRRIVEAQASYGWGNKVLEQLAADLQISFPGIEGFSRRSLYRMRAFYLAHCDAEEFVSQVATQLPWFHNVVLVEKVKDPAQRVWYGRAAVQHGWSRAVLEHQIETRLFERQGQALNNFERTLPSPQSDLARQLLKDPYHFDFLTLGPDAHERQLEAGLLEHLRQFLLELGAGFAFVGSQYELCVSEKSYFLDLLFYHLHLRCFIVVDLKMHAFEPEFAGKMNFYLAAADDQLRHADDAPSIGLLLCKTKDALTVEYALRGTTTPMGVAQWQIGDALPNDLQGQLPTAEALEAELKKPSGEVEL